MAWDTEATRRRLLDAGARQFAAHGFAGARVDAIGRDAGVNKERVYRYFGDKQGLFAAVLAEELGGMLDGVEVAGAGAAAVGQLAGTLFDRLVERPQLARLLAWESLELDAAVALEDRRPLCAGTASRLRRAVPSLDEAASEQLLLTLVTVAAGWTTLRRVADAVVGTEVGDDARRDAVVGQARALAVGLGAARPPLDPDRVG